MTGKQDLVTAGALAAFAFMAADLSHEVIGHGTVAFLEHAKQIQLSYTALSTDVAGRALVLAGPLINLVFGGIAYLALRMRRFVPATEWFLFLFASMSLLNLSSYLILSGVTNTGDLAVALVGLPRILALRWFMGLLGVGTYIALIPAFGRIFSRFAAPSLSLCAVGYVVPILLNSLAAILSPLGLHYYLLSALPATAGVNVYLFFMPKYSDKEQVYTKHLIVPRSLPTVLIAILLAAMYVLLLGPGIKLR